MKTTRLYCLIILLIIPTVDTLAQQGYRDYAQITAYLEKVCNNSENICSMTSIAQTHSGKNIWLITAGTGDRHNKPAVVIAGGVDGRYPLGREIAASFAGKLVNNMNDQEVKKLLSDITFYIIPDISPDASEQFFLRPLYERGYNDNPVDNDRDFLLNEDPYDDLNGDGLISYVRIKDTSGDYVQDSDEPRLMRKADRSKGEKGEWKLISEGRDNDGDGNFNEDGSGGVNINNNFTYNYEEWGSYAGINAVSEPESRALADFLFDSYNVFCVIVIGPQDNLGKPWESKKAAANIRQRGRIVTNIQPEDEEINKLVSGLYLSATSYKESPAGTDEQGNFAEWAYYHYGRYTFSTPGWWFPLNSKKETERSFYSWADNNNLSGYFTEWQAIDHPDFPGKYAEAGGLNPFALTTPPASSLDSIINNHYDFIIKTARLHPSIRIKNLETEQIGNKLYRIKLHLSNNGIMSTSSQHGQNNKWLRKITVEISGNKELEFVSGRKKLIEEALKGGEEREISWLIRGNGKIKIRAGAVNCGFDEVETELK